MIKIGNGIDIHQFKNGDGFKLGGIFIPCNYEIIAHSDGDVLYHALSDSILGSIGERDIGFHFPDTSELNKGLDSSKIVLYCLNLLHKKDYVLGNIDLTILLQTPKIAPYIEKIKENISKVVNIDINCISVKATTTEHLGFVGRKEGIVVFCSILAFNKKIETLFASIAVK